MTGRRVEIYDRPQRANSSGTTVESRSMRAPKDPEKGPRKEPEKGPGRFHASRETRCVFPAPNTSEPATEHGPAAPVPMHTTAGFLPALIAARRRRPETPMAAWRAVANLTAAPGEHHVSAAALCALVDDIATTTEHHG
jgi:hypothetical protein